MLTEKDLKKIEELLQPKFDSIELRLEKIDKRLDAVEERLNAVEKRLDAIEKRLNVVEERLNAVEEKLDVHDSKFDQIFNSLIDIDKRIENLVEVVATHTDMLKDINFRVIAIERHLKSNMQYIQNIDLDVGLQEERLHQLEAISGILNTLRDKSKDRYKYIKP